MIWQSVLVLITNVVKNQFMLKSDQSTNCKERIGTYTTIQIQKDGELVAKTVWLLVKRLETITMPVRLETVKLPTYIICLVRTLKQFMVCQLLPKNERTNQIKSVRFLEEVSRR